MPEPTFTKNGTVRARVSDSVRDRLDAIHSRHRTNDSQVLAALVEAFCESVEAVDAVRFPVAVLLADKQLLVAEHGPGKGSATTPGKPPDKAQRHRGDGPRAKVS